MYLYRLDQYQLRRSFRKLRQFERAITFSIFTYQFHLKLMPVPVASGMLAYSYSWIAKSEANGDHADKKDPCEWIYRSVVAQLPVVRKGTPHP